MPKTQLRMPRKVAPRVETVAPEPAIAQARKKIQLTVPGADRVKVPVQTARATKAASVSVETPRAVRGTTTRARAVPEAPVAASVVETPAPRRGKNTATTVRASTTPGPQATAEKKPRTPRVRTKVAVHKFFPRVERLATLKTPRAIEYLQNIESRAQEVRRADFSQKFPLSILEMKALNEAIRIMQVKLTLEQEYAAEVLANGAESPKAKKTRA
jgi:hypothetical protein